MRFLLSLLSLVMVAVVILVFYLIGLVIEPLPQTAKDILLVIGGIAFFIVANIREYRSAYVKGTGKPWHFWLYFITTIAFALVIIGLFAKG